MAQFDFLDNTKNRLIEQFTPTSGSANPTLPPAFGQTPTPPDVGMPSGGAPQGMDSFLPPDTAGIPQPTQQAVPPAAAQGTPSGGLAQITLQDLLGLGLNALLLGLLSQNSPLQGPQQGGQNATQGSVQGQGQ